MAPADRTTSPDAPRRDDAARSASRHRLVLWCIGLVGLFGIGGASLRIIWMLVVAATMPAMVGASILATMHARRAPTDPWWRLGHGLIGVTLANLAAWQTFQGSATLGAAAGIYLTVSASGALLGTGMVGLTEADPASPARTRQRFDAFAVMVATAYAWWMLTRDSLDGGRTRAEQALLLLGPMSAAIAVGLALFVWSRPIRSDGRAARVASTGVALIGIGSGLGTWLWAIGREQLALFLLGIQLAGAMVCGIAAVGATEGRPAHPTPAPFWGALLTPLALAGSLAIGGMVLVGGPRLETDGLVGFVVLTVVALLRQGMAMAENQRLTRSLGRSVERLRHQATHDPTTGLTNRTHLLERIGEVVDPTADIALVLVNLDRFQHVNDTLGHPRGDTLLRVCADRIAATLHADDVLAHLGSDEFAVWRPGADVAELHNLATAVSSRIAEPVDLGGVDVVVTASIGIACTPRRDHPVEQAPSVALQHADLALRAAKHRGRDRIEVFDPDMARAVRRRISLAAEIRRALARGEFEIYYQPLVGFGDRRIVGAEALVRWNHPDRGVLTPEHFLDVAEEIGALTTIGRQSLVESCRRFAVLNRQLTDRPIRLAVNQSAAELRAPDVVEFTARTLEESAFDPGLLILEVSEEILADPDTAAVLERLHELGIQLSIDDFGTGYSSLRQLRRFPAHEVKIDRSFVSNVVDDPADRTVVAAVCQLGHGLGLQVVAEGVETEAQAEALSALGCDTAQGWLFGRPQPFSRLVTAVQRRDRTPVDDAGSDLDADRPEVQPT